MSKKLIVKEIILATQSLKIEQEYPEEHLKTYELVPNEKYPPAKLIYEDNKVEKKFNSLEELGEFLQLNSINLLNIGRYKTVELSEFLSRFLQLGRVVNNHPLYASLKRKYNICNLEEYSPKIKGKEIIFVTYFPKIESDFIAPLIEIKCSLIDLKYEKREIASSKISEIADLVG